MRSPPMVPDRPLAQAVSAALGEPPTTVLVVGSARLATSLTREGHGVTLRPSADGAADQGPLFSAGSDELERYDGVVLVQQMKGRAAPLSDLCGLTRAARPGALVLLAEQAAWGGGGRWLGRVLKRAMGRPLVSDASELAALCLNAGLCGLRQTWPQGLRSLVLTWGRVSPVARALRVGDEGTGDHGGL